MAAEERFSLKDHLFNPVSVGRLAGWIADADPSFDRVRFESDVLSRMPDLELKERIELMAEVLEDQLPSEYAAAADIVERALPAPLDPTLSDDDFGDFVIAPLGSFVVNNGLAPADYVRSMTLLREITKRFSMEGSIRPFISEYPEATMGHLAEWADDPNYHVRRLVSEGTRPLLPWSPRIPIDVAEPIPLLDKLHADPTRYVTRSVANHLNDISKIEPTLVIDALGRWAARGQQDPKELDWMSRHSLRTLVKKGDPDAMLLLGYSPDPKVSVSNLEIESDGPIQIGDVLSFSFDLTAHQSEKLLVDFVIDFVKKNGDRKPKVFKMKSLELAAGETATLGKNHRLPRSATTFTLYPGIQRLTVMVNGNETASTEFELID